MKYCVVFLVLVPLVCCSLVGEFTHLFNVPELKNIVQQIADKVGSDATEKGCESECVVLLTTENLLSSACDLICKSFQALISRFHIA